MAECKFSSKFLLLLLWICFHFSPFVEVCCFFPLFSMAVDGWDSLLNVFVLLILPRSPLPFSNLLMRFILIKRTLGSSEEACFSSPFLWFRARHLVLVVFVD